MGDFFHGWRRKLGIAALLFTLLLTIVWMRRYYVNDLFIVQDAGFYWESRLDGFDWGWDWRPEVPGPAVEWCYADLSKLRPKKRKPLDVSYWPCVLVSTFLSAYLLLAKPPTAKSKVVGKKADLE
jgi:hypothetical protein